MCHRLPGMADPARIKVAGRVWLAVAPERRALQGQKYIL